MATAQAQQERRQQMTSEEALLNPAVLRSLFCSFAAKNLRSSENKRELTGQTRDGVAANRAYGDVTGVI
jgi:hypothetical protein